jgi:hypothetical protein
LLLLVLLALQARRGVPLVWHGHKALWHNHAVVALQRWLTLIKGSCTLTLSAASDAFCTLGATRKVPTARPASKARNRAGREVPLLLLISIEGRLVGCQ